MLKEDTERKIISVTEAASQFGVSQKTLRRAIQRDEVFVFRVGHNAKQFLRAQDFREWLQRKQTGGSNEKEQ